jgi:hypothetical protein
MGRIAVALEVGKKRAFASALDWPGWTRSGRSAAEALETLLAYAPRYEHVVGRSRLGFEAPEDAQGFDVVETLPGDATTDFGAPNIAATAESKPLYDGDLKRLTTILEASLSALQKAVEAADGLELRKGPRGGGRTVSQIVDHVLGAHQSYLRQVYFRDKLSVSNELAGSLEAVKRADAQALTFAASDQMPATGARGGALWTPRYFARRAAWHVLDHAWEIEDKVID